MGRRKIEIKAIKDDRNRSVTFLKRKGGLFKKAHELSVLCSVDVAVFIFGSNKKLYEYSSGDMRELITRYTYHGGPTEHKGPSDFNGGADDDEDEDENGTPPHAEVMDAHMLPPHFQGQQPFAPHIRHHTPSASPPIPNGVTFAQHAHAVQRGHTPQPQIGSRPGSRNDMRRMGPNMMGQPVGPHPPPQGPQVNGFAFVPQPAIYTPQNPTTMAPQMPPHMAPGPQYPFPPPQPHAHQMQPYMEDQRRSSMPPSFPPQGPPQVPQVQRHSVSPPQPHSSHLPQLPPQPIQQHPHPHPHPHPSPPQPLHHHMESPPQPPPVIHEPPQQQQPQPPPPPPAITAEVKSEPVQERIPQSSLLDTAVKKLPRQKQHSIFTPIDENRSILSQHLAAFHAEPQKMEGGTPPHRSSSLDGGIPRQKGATSSPPMPHRTDTHPHPKSRTSVSSIPETTFTPPSRSNSLRVGGPRPRLTVQIPDEASDDNSATAESASSPRGGASTDATSQSTRRNTDSHSSGMVLPPPSPSASALLSAGATGPPNPFARPPPQQPSQSGGPQQPNGLGAGAMNIDTPVSALPSRFLHNTDFLPSPSTFYPDWNFRGSDSNTLPSPLNFATPVVGTGPSFLRDESGGGPTAAGSNKRKSPDLGHHLLPHLHGHHGPTSDPIDAGNEPKRVKVDS